ncbi:hypothetical protein AnigIFM50267_000415 [Aspergillus niger]|nr:hypothetical protein AnigIFM50267_000415 [Aspergillus niger]
MTIHILSPADVLNLYKPSPPTRTSLEAPSTIKPSQTNLLKDPNLQHLNLFSTEQNQVHTSIMRFTALIAATMALAGSAAAQCHAGSTANCKPGFDYCASTLKN